MPEAPLTDPWLLDLVKNLAGVVVGWFLGFASAISSDWWKKRNRVRTIKRAVSRELRELAHRCVFYVFAVARKRGTIDRDLLKWMKEQLSCYTGPNPIPATAEGLEKMLKMDASELDAALPLANEMFKAAARRSFIPREEASYATVAASQVHDFAPDYAVRLLDILSHLRMYNEARENQTYYFRLTFDASLSEESHANAIQNVDGAEDAMALRARIIVDKITELEKLYPT